MLSSILTIVIALAILVGVVLFLKWLWANRETIITWAGALLVLVMCPLIAHRTNGGFFVVVFGLVVGYSLCRVILSRLQSAETVSMSYNVSSFFRRGFTTSSHPGSHPVTRHQRTSILGNVHWVSEHMRSNPSAHEVSSHFVEAFTRQVTKIVYTSTHWLLQAIVSLLFAAGRAVLAMFKQVWGRLAM